MAKTSSFKAVSTSLGERMAAAKKTFGTRTLWAIGMGAAFIPVVGLGVSHLVERRKNALEAHNQKEVLADYYRKPVAARLGISANSVKASDLKLAAKTDSSIAQAVQKIDAEHNSANRSSALSSAGAYALGGFVDGGFQKMALEMGGSVVGGAASGLMDKKVLHVHDVVVRLDAKRAQGQKIHAADIVLLNIAKDEQWQEEFKKKHKKAFGALSEEEQQQFIAANMTSELVQAEKKAYAVNSDLISIQSIATAGPESTSTFADTIASKSNVPSFTAVEDQRRKAAAQAVNTATV